MQTHICERACDNEKLVSLHFTCRLVDMDLLSDMLANMFKSDARTFHRRLAVLRCFRPDNPTGITCITAFP